MKGVCEDTPGVKKAEVKVKDRLLTVEHDESVRPEQLSQALGGACYPVEPG